MGKKEITLLTRHLGIGRTSERAFRPVCIFVSIACSSRPAISNDDLTFDSTEGGTGKTAMFWAGWGVRRGCLCMCLHCCIAL